MDFCCSRCGGRQEREARCDRCGDDTVHDLRSRRTRDLLEEVEIRLRNQREGRFRTVAVIGAMVLVIGIWLVPGFWGLRARFFAVPLLLDQIALMVAVAYGLVVLLERRFERPRFPYLEALPPPDRA